MFDIIGKRKWILITAAVYLAVAAIAIGIFRLKPGIEFSSGSILTVNFEQAVVQPDLQQALADNGFADSIIQRTSGGDYIIRTQEISGTDKTALEKTLSDKFGALKEVEFNSISPMIASETTKNTAIAVGIALIGILLYITWAFRHMPNPFLFGASAVLALAHDALFTIGFFAIAGRYLDWDVNLMFITGILALVGYSVNNTVVVFDRIRENMNRRVARDFATVVNISQLETLGRCLNSVITTQITVLAILLFVGASIRNFAVVLFVGLLAGTFSSTFIAPALLVVWEKNKPVKTAP
jgi:preprotein translocase subunit SecF